VPYSQVRFFRVLKGFVAQFGISGDPATAAKWKSASIKDDPVTHSNKRGEFCRACASVAIF
jgi:peptidyl-prolyl cis-trans isomerase A (cyclophilin A)